MWMIPVFANLQLPEAVVPDVLILVDCMLLLR